MTNIQDAIAQLTELLNKANDPIAQVAIGSCIATIAQLIPDEKETMFQLWDAAIHNSPYVFNNHDSVQAFNKYYSRFTSES